MRTPKDLFSSLKQGTIEPVYFLFGPEAYLRDRAARAIADEALRGTLLREFNEASFSLISDDVRAAIAAAEQLPMMARRRVVRIKDFAKLPEAAEEFLLRYVERPVESSVVIFITADIDKRKKLAKTLMQGAAFEFQPLKTNELSVWAKSYVKELKTEIEPRALQRLIELVTSNLHVLANELNKLAAAALPSGRITLELVDALSIRSREHQNYELTDHMLARNGKAAVKTLKELLDDGVEPVMLIGLIAGTYRRLALAKGLLSRGASPGEIFSEVRMPSFKQGAYLSILNRLDSRTIAKRIQRIAEADLNIKTSKATPRMQVEMLVCELVM
jgi:DNA polymerase III subunit delta